MKVPEAAPDLSQLDLDEVASLVKYIAGGEKAVPAKYLHWDELRRREPPMGMSARAWWAVVKSARQVNRVDVPLPSLGAASFHLVRTPAVQRALSFVDRNMAGQLASGHDAVQQVDPARVILRSLREEAVQSSLLEGAATTRQEALDLLRSGRPPQTHGEKMVANNYAAIQWVREHRDEPISVAGLCELHAVLTQGTLSDPAQEGQLQQPGESRVVVRDRQTNEVLYTPPSAEHLPTLLDALIELACGGEETEPWLHPVERAILCHFGLSWIHPFEDGNGRTARALFYWVMLQRGYWFTEYITLSKYLRNAPAAYARSFLYTETDDNDVTYFLLHQLEIVERAFTEVQRRVSQRTAELRQLERSARLDGVLNHRQLALVQHALRHNHPEYTIASHQRSHGVSYPTARQDLIDLESLGLLRSFKRSRAKIYVPVDDLEAALQRAGHQ